MPVKKSMGPKDFNAGTVKSVDRLRSDLRKGGNTAFFYRPKPGEDLLVRFLTEPDGWLEFFQHFDQANKRAFPCLKHGCPGCDDDMPRSQKYVANAVNTATDQVIALLMPRSLARLVFNKYDKLHTLVDRDYFIDRTGSGKDDTTYDATPDTPKTRRIGKYELLDLHQMLADMAEDAFGGKDTTKGPARPHDDDEELDDVIVPSRTKGRAAKKAIASRHRRPVLEDDEDEEDDKPTGLRRPVKKAGKVLAKKAAAKPVRRMRRG